MDSFPRPLLPILLSLLITAIASFGLIRLAHRTGFVAHPRADRYHRKPVPLLGGAAWLLGTVAAAVLTGFFVHTPPSTGASTSSLLTATGIGLAGFFLLGLRDDRWPLAPFPKGGLQLLLLGTVLVVWRPSGPLAHPFGLAIAGLAGLILINAWNYLDHADGILSTVGGIAGAVLGLAIGSVLTEGPFPWLVWGGAGGLLGFLLWNLPPARVFLGDSGSLSIGFLMVLSSLVLIERGGPEARAAAAAAHAVPLADFLLVTLVRLGRRQNPFRGGREHTGHRLFRAIGPSGALLVLAACSTGFGLLGLLYGRYHPRGGPALVAGLVLIAALILMAISPPAPLPAPVVPRTSKRRRGGKR